MLAVAVADGLASADAVSVVFAVPLAHDDGLCDDDTVALPLPLSDANGLPDWLALAHAEKVPELDSVALARAVVESVAFGEPVPHADEDGDTLLVTLLLPLGDEDGAADVLLRCDAETENDEDTVPLADWEKDALTVGLATSDELGEGDADTVAEAVELGEADEDTEPLDDTVADSDAAALADSVALADGALVGVACALAVVVAFADADTVPHADGDDDALTVAVPGRCCGASRRIL
jgi:hypothetical protein